MSDFDAASATASPISSVNGPDLPKAASRPPILRLVEPQGTLAEVPDAWWPILLRLGLPQETIGKLLRLAGSNGTSFQTELLASGIVGETRLCREIARELRIPVIDRVDAGQLVMRRRERETALRMHRGIPFVLVRENSELLRLLFSPARMELTELHRLIEARPGLRGRLGVVVPTALRKAIVAASRQDVEERARTALYVETPRLSARNVFDGRQGAIGGALVVSLIFAFWLNAPAAWLGLHIIFSVFFLAYVSLRLAAAVSASPPLLAPLKRVPGSDLPVYTVLVALYREAEIDPQLISALSRIRWPRSKMEIKLVCEADDVQTLGALSALRLHPCIEVIKEPPGEPRTKPKALAFALPLSSGEFVTLYDAEDQPHPGQLDSSKNPLASKWCCLLGRFDSDLFCL